MLGGTYDGHGLPPSPLTADDHDCGASNTERFGEGGDNGRVRRAVNGRRGHGDPKSGANGRAHRITSSAWDNLNVHHQPPVISFDSMWRDRS